MYASCRRITIVRLVVASAVLEIFVYTNGTMKIRTGNLKETAEVARQFLKEVVIARKSRGAVVVGLSGNLGAGKTAFAKACAKAMDIRETVMSPTFVLERVYRIPAKNFTAKRFDHFIHIDAYRLSGREELAHLGWSDIVKNKRNLIFVEWPEIVKKAMPKDMITVRFKHIDEKTREVSINGKLKFQNVR